MSDFDDILQEIGDFGRFQIINYLLLCVPMFLCGANSLTYVFTAGTPHYRCYVDGCDRAADPVFADKWVSAAIPPSSDGQCLQYVPRTNFSQGFCHEGQFEAATMRCNRWVFEDNERTIVGEWNMTCVENQWKLSLVGTTHFLGILLGSAIFGVLADRFGRKVIFVFCLVAMSVTGIAQALSDDYIVFQVFGFANALVSAGVYPSAFILAVELVGPRKREMAGVILNYCYAFGKATIGLIAWLSKDWVVTRLVISVPPILCIIYHWMVPESVRWLLANGEKGKAGVIVRKAAAMNGVALPVELVSLVEEVSPNVGDAQPGLSVAVRQLLRSRVLCVRSLLLCYIWASNAFVYYGLSVNSTTLGGNKYLNFVLVCLVEIPGYTLSWWTMNKLGRRWSICGCMLLCGLTCAAATLVPADITWAVVLLFLSGKFGITASFGVAYVYTAELYPTVIRSAGVATCSTAARLGAVLAAFAPLLGQYSKPLPLFLFSGVSLIAAVIAWWLPETLGNKLPDTIADASQLK